MHLTILSRLFSTRDRLARRLAVVDKAINAVGRSYSKEQGYLFPLTTSRLRNEVERKLSEK